jgi:hypothetical protein
MHITLLEIHNNQEYIIINLKPIVHVTDLFNKLCMQDVYKQYKTGFISHV